MSSCGSFVKEHCATCNEVTLHDGLGCIHRAKTPHPDSSPKKGAVDAPRYNGQREDRAKRRIQQMIARNRTASPEVEVTMAAMYAAGSDRNEIAKKLGLNASQVSFRLDVMRTRLGLDSIRQLRNFAKAESTEAEAMA